MKKILSFLVILFTTINFTFALSSNTSNLNLEFNLHKGSTDLTNNGEVTELQNFLYPKYLQVQPSGIFGSKTFSAVKAFQKENNLSQVGIVGPATRALIKSLTSQTTITVPVVATSTNTIVTTTIATSSVPQQNIPTLYIQASQNNVGSFEIYNNSNTVAEIDSINFSPSLPSGELAIKFPIFIPPNNSYAFNLIPLTHHTYKVTSSTAGQYGEPCAGGIAGSEYCTVSVSTITTNSLQTDDYVNHYELISSSKDPITGYTVNAINTNGNFKIDYLPFSF